MTELEQHLKDVDRKKVINAVKLQLPIEVTSYTLSRNMEAYIKGVEEEFLDVCHHEHLKEYLNFCLGELLTNSKKANTKRVYFKEKGLDINDPDDYAKGMETFKEETFNDIEHYLEMQKKHGLYVKLLLQYKRNQIIISIKNNSVLTTFEEERINQKLQSAQQFNNMEDVVSNILDQSEGAGLGLIIILLMLEKVGLSKDNFKIYSDDKETITQIILPCERKIAAGVEIVSYEFISMQSKIPVIQKNFDQVNKIAAQKPINRSELAACVRKDPSLTLLAFKYALKKGSVSLNIPQAISLLSDDELSFIYSDSNPVCEFINPDKEQEKAWTHAKKSAFYAYNLYKNCNKENLSDDEEFFYTAGLLADFGKILLLTASQEQKSYVKDLSNQYEDAAEKILDVFKLGNASNYLTYLYMKKFGFSDDIATKLSYWNEIDTLAQDKLPVEKILYLAQVMNYYDEEMVDFYQIDKEILSEFNIFNEKQFKSVIQKLNSAM